MKSWLQKNFKSIMTEQLTLSKASKIIGVKTKTLRNWDDAGKIKTTRTSGNHRRISMNEIRRLQVETQSYAQIKTHYFLLCSYLLSSLERK